MAAAAAVSTARVGTSSPENDKFHIHWKQYTIDREFLKWFRELNQFNNSTDTSQRYKLPEEMKTIRCEVLTELRSTVTDGRKSKEIVLQYPPGNLLRAFQLLLSIIYYIHERIQAPVESAKTKSGKENSIRKTFQDEHTIYSKLDSVLIASACKTFASLEAASMKEFPWKFFAPHANPHYMMLFDVQHKEYKTMNEKAKELKNKVDNASRVLDSLSKDASNFSEHEATLNTFQNEKKAVDSKVLHFITGFLNHVKSFYVNLYKERDDINADYVYLQLLADQLDVIFIIFTSDSCNPESTTLFFHSDYSVIQPMFRNKRKRMTCIFLAQFDDINSSERVPPQYFQLVRLTAPGNDITLVNHIVNTLAGTKQVKQEGGQQKNLIDSWHSRWHSHHWCIYHRMKEKRNSKSNPSSSNDNEEEENDREDIEEEDTKEINRYKEFDKEEEIGDQFVTTHIDNFIKQLNSMPIEAVLLSPVPAASINREQPEREKKNHNVFPHPIENSRSKSNLSLVPSLSSNAIHVGDTKRLSTGSPAVVPPSNPSLLTDPEVVSTPSSTTSPASITITPIANRKWIDVLPLDVETSLANDGLQFRCEAVDAVRRGQTKGNGFLESVADLLTIREYQESLAFGMTSSAAAMDQYPHDIDHIGKVKLKVHDLHTRRKEKLQKDNLIHPKTSDKIIAISHLLNSSIAIYADSPLKVITQPIFAGLEQYINHNRTKHYTYLITCTGIGPSLGISTPIAAPRVDGSTIISIAYQPKNGLDHFLPLIPVDANSHPSQLTSTSTSEDQLQDKLKERILLPSVQFTTGSTPDDNNQLQLAIEHDDIAPIDNHLENSFNVITSPSNSDPLHLPAAAPASTMNIGTIGTIGTSVEMKENWACSKCTFNNEEIRAVCKMCDNIKPISTSPSSMVLDIISSTSATNSLISSSTSSSASSSSSTLVPDSTSITTNNEIPPAAVPRRFIGGKEPRMNTPTDKSNSPTNSNVPPLLSPISISTATNKELPAQQNLTGKESKDESSIASVNVSDDDGDNQGDDDDDDDDDDAYDRDGARGDSDDTDSDSGDSDADAPRWPDIIRTRPRGFGKKVSWWIPMESDIPSAIGGVEKKWFKGSWRPLWKDALLWSGYEEDSDPKKCVEDTNFLLSLRRAIVKLQTLRNQTITKATKSKSKSKIAVALKKFFTANTPKLIPTNIRVTENGEHTPVSMQPQPPRPPPTAPLKKKRGRPPGSKNKSALTTLTVLKKRTSKESGTKETPPLMSQRKPHAIYTPKKEENKKKRKEHSRNEVKINKKPKTTSTSTSTRDKGNPSLSPLDKNKSASNERSARARGRGALEFPHGLVDTKRKPNQLQSGRGSKPKKKHLNTSTKGNPDDSIADSMPDGITLTNSSPVSEGKMENKTSLSTSSSSSLNTETLETLSSKFLALQKEIIQRFGLMKESTPSTPAPPTDIPTASPTPGLVVPIAISTLTNLPREINSQSNLDTPPMPRSKSPSAATSPLMSNNNTNNSTPNSNRSTRYLMPSPPSHASPTSTSPSLPSTATGLSHSDSPQMDGSISGERSAPRSGNRTGHRYHSPEHSAHPSGSAAGSNSSSSPMSRDRHDNRKRNREGHGHRGRSKSRSRSRSKLSRSRSRSSSRSRSRSPSSLPKSRGRRKSTPTRRRKNPSSSANGNSNSTMDSILFKAWIDRYPSLPGGIISKLLASAAPGTATLTNSNSESSQYPAAVAAAASSSTTSSTIHNNSHVQSLPVYSPPPLLNTPTAPPPSNSIMPTYIPPIIGIGTGGIGPFLSNSPLQYQYHQHVPMLPLVTGPLPGPSYPIPPSPIAHAPIGHNSIIAPSSGSLQPANGIWCRYRQKTSNAQLPLCSFCTGGYELPH